MAKAALLVACASTAKSGAQPSTSPHIIGQAGQRPSADYPPADTAGPYRPGVISTPDHDEGGLLLAPHGETYFWRRHPGEKQQIYLLRDGATAPERLSFSTDRDESPFLTRDGRTMYFGSEREIPGRPNRGNFDMNVWVTRRDSVGGAWSAPEPLPPDFNEVQAEGEQWPAANASAVVSYDDTTFYVSTQRRGDVATRLYRYRRDPATDELVDPRLVDGLFDDPRYAIGCPTITPDGQYMFFSSYGAPGGAGGEDLYVSRRLDDGTWSHAVALASVNTRHEEAGPYVGPAGDTLFFGKAYLLDADEWTYTPWSVYAVPLAGLDLAELSADQ